MVTVLCFSKFVIDFIVSVITLDINYLRKKNISISVQIIVHISKNKLFRIEKMLFENLFISSKSLAEYLYILLNNIVLFY